MNKLFYFLLFCSVAGAGVLWWLLRSSQHQDQKLSAHGESKIAVPEGLVIEDRPSIPRDVRAGDAETPPTDDAAGSHEEAHSDVKAEPHGAQTKDAHEAPAKKEILPKGDAKASVLAIASEPSGVMVFVNGKEVGKTPLERTLTNKVQKIRFEKEGFVPVERDAPGEARPEGAYMSWRINMVAQQLPASQKKRIDEVGSFFLKGVSGPVFIQIKAVSSDLEARPVIVKQVQELRAKLREERVFACEVSLGSKGNWSRILAGPFDSRDEARKSLGFFKEGLKVDDLFVTGEQSCL